MSIIENIKADVQVFDLKNESYYVSSLSVEGSNTFFEYFKCRHFTLHESELSKLLLFCAACGLNIAAPLDQKFNTLRPWENQQP